jgi:hypothetical protein
MDNSSNAILEQILLELQKHTGILDKHTEILDHHTKLLDEHTKILGEHTKILDEHTIILDDHTREIKSVKKSVDTLDNTVNKWVFSEIDRLETKLTKRIEDLEKRIS